MGRRAIVWELLPLWIGLFYCQLMYKAIPESNDNFQYISWATIFSLLPESLIPID